MAQLKKLTKGKGALLVLLAAGGAYAAATVLHGWQVYAGFATVGVALLVGFLRFNRDS